MKLISFIVALYTLPAFALWTVSLENPIPGKVERIQLSQTKNGDWLVNKNSNALNLSDLRIGNLKITKSPETHKLLARIEKVNQTINETEKLLKEKSDTSYDSVTAPAKGSHETYVSINGRPLSKKSPYFDELQSIIKSFATLPMELQDGARLDAKQENLEFLKNGKQVDSLKFVKGAYCDGIEKDLKCRVRDWGIIYIQ